MNSLEYIVVHHSLVQNKANRDQFNAINDNHKGLKFPISDLGYHCGYHYVINEKGEIKQARYDNEVGAHTKERLMNYRSIGICVTGNFDIEDPTAEQLESLRSLIKKLQDNYAIPNDKVVRHNFFAPYKSCSGLKLGTDLIQRLLTEDPVYSHVSEWAKESVKFCKEYEIASQWQNPQSPITKEEMAVMLYRFYNKFIK